MDRARKDESFELKKKTSHPLEIFTINFAGTLGNVLKHGLLNNTDGFSTFQDLQNKAKIKKTKVIRPVNACKLIGN